MVQNEGGRISITGSPPHGQYYASARRGSSVHYASSRGRSYYGSGYAVADPFAALFGGGLF
jgi:hypothetical protein